MSLVTVDNLTVAFGGRAVVNNVSFTLDRGETLALVGESGSGKSLTALSLLQLLPPGANCAGRIVVDRQSVIGARDGLLRRLRGGVAGMVFQEPMTSLNPLKRIGKQIAEAVRLHQRVTPRGSGAARVTELLNEVGFPDAAHRLDAFPHQLSGGQRQRVMIAMALANDPAVADRGRADDSTRRHHPGADPETAGGGESGARAGAAADQPRPGDRAPLCRPGLRDEGWGRSSSQGSVAEVFDAPLHPYTGCCWPPSRAAAAAAAPERGHADRRDAMCSVHFPIRRGVLRRTVGYVRAVDGVDRCRFMRAKPSGWSARAAPASPPWAMRCCGWCAAEGGIRFDGADLATLDQKRLRRLRARYADRVPGPVRQPVAADDGRRRSSPRGWPCMSRR